MRDTSDATDVPLVYILLLFRHYCILHVVSVSTHKSQLKRFVAPQISAFSRRVLISGSSASKSQWMRQYTQICKVATTLGPTKTLTNCLCECVKLCVSVLPWPHRLLFVRLAVRLLSMWCVLGIAPVSTRESLSCVCV